MLSKEALRRAARVAGADLMGVADVARFDELPKGKHPRSIFPEARSVIVLGRRVNRGALRGVEEGTHFASYDLYGLQWLDNRFVSLTTFRVAEFLEDHGWEAVPLPNLPPEIPPQGVAVRPGQPEPNVMLDCADAAVRAGLGEIGYCDVLLTPRFGPRQRIQLILTDARIKPDPLFSGAICPRDASCPGFCPLGAMAGESRRAICGRSFAVARVDDRKCRRCTNGAVQNPYHRGCRPDRLAAVCLRTCVDFLERSGRVANRFVAPFRKREPWVAGRQTAGT